MRILWSYRHPRNSVLHNMRLVIMTGWTFLHKACIILFITIYGEWRGLLQVLFLQVLFIILLSYTLWYVCYKYCSFCTSFVRSVCSVQMRCATISGVHYTSSVHCNVQRVMTAGLSIAGRATSSTLTLWCFLKHRRFARLMAPWCPQWKMKRSRAL